METKRIYVAEIWHVLGPPQTTRLSLGDFEIIDFIRREEISFQNRRSENC